MSRYESCPRYWRGCFSCPYFMREEVFFCRKENMARYGTQRVDVEIQRQAKAEMSRCWWKRERG